MTEYSEIIVVFFVLTLILNALWGWWLARQRIHNVLILSVGCVVISFVFIFVIPSLLGLL